MSVNSSTETWTTISSVIQAGAAVISLIVVSVLTGINNSLAKRQALLLEEQRTQEEERRQRESRRVALIVHNRMQLLRFALEQASKGDLTMFKQTPHDKGLPVEVILQYLDDDIVIKIFDAWNPVDVLAGSQDLISVIVQARRSNIVDQYLPQWDSTMNELKAYAQT